jgi:hypothetical protein
VPFPPQKPKPFDRKSVESLRPGTIGCYGLFRKDRWVYIGKGDIRQRLLGHLDGDLLRVLHNHPTHWVALETADLDTAEAELVLDCDPICKPAIVMDFGRPTQRVQRTDRRGSGR